MSLWQQFVQLDLVAYLAVVVRTAVVYVALWGGFRLVGKRELGQMTAFDFVVVLIIANAVQNAMVGPDTTLTGGLVAAATIFAVNRLFIVLALRSNALASRLRGTPTLLVHEGRFLADRLRREGLSEEEVMQAMREHGVDDLADVKLAVLEVDGTISIVPSGAAVQRTRRRLRGRKPVG